MEPIFQSCKICSSIVQEQMAFVQVCRACSLQLIYCLTSPEKFSPLQGVTELDLNQEKLEKAFRDQIISQNPIKDDSFYEDHSQRSRDQKAYIERLFNLSLFPNSTEESCEISFVSFTHCLLVKYIIDSEDFEEIGKFTEIKRSVKFIQTYFENGLIFLCEWKNEIINKIEEFNYFLFNKNFGLCLEDYGTIRFYQKPHFCSFENEVYAFFKEYNIEKYSTTDRKWVQTFCSYYGAENISSVQFGSKIILAAQNKKSIDAYSPLEDKILEIEKNYFSTNEEKIMLKDNEVLYFVGRNKVWVYNLRTSESKIHNTVPNIIQRLIRPPVLYRGKFYMITFENSLTVFDTTDLKIRTIDISKKLTKINYKYSFLY